MPTMHLCRADGGLLVEHWGLRDELSALWQVGALPPPAPVPLAAGLARPGLRRSQARSSSDVRPWSG